MDLDLNVAEQPKTIRYFRFDSGSGATTFYYLSTGVTGGNGIAFTTPTDLDGDHIMDYVYAGDLKGNVWRFDLTSSDPWILGQGRFLVITITKDRPSSAGTVFQAGDGTFFVFSPARTRKQADRLAASIPRSTVVVVRPSFSFPAKEWVAADPRFWRAKAQ